MSNDERMATAARRMVRDCAGVRAGQNVYIEGRTDAAEYLELLAFECELVGALPMVVILSDARRHRRLTELPAEQLERTSDGWIAAIKAADVTLSIQMEYGDPRLFAHTTAAQNAAAGVGRKLLIDQMFADGRRWIGSDFPTAGQAEVFGYAAQEYIDLFWDAVDVDYALLAERAGAVCRVLRGAREVHITSAKGTDLTLRIDGRPLLQDLGVLSDDEPYANVPSGEVCLAPIEDSAQGTVVFDVACWEGRWVEDLEVAFEAGVAHGVRAARGLEHFNATLASATGAGNVIGELGIGLNDRVTVPCGNMLMDEKILGTIHIAVGDNHDFGGANESSLHWDLLVMQPTVTVDGVPLLAEGRLLV